MEPIESIAFSEQQKQALAALGVSVVYLFGSRAMGTAGERSDYDVGIVFTDPSAVVLDIKTYGALYDILSKIFPDSLSDGPRLDISMLQQANAALQMAAINYGRVLFEIDPRVRADYEESVVRRYDDYRYLQRMYEEANFAAFRVPQPAYV